MSQEKVHDRLQNRRFTLVVVPGEDSARTRTYSISKWGIIAAFFGSFFVIAGVVFTVIVFTPARILLPISNPALEQQYGKQIVQVQEQVNRMLNEMTLLREYNARLRSALGDREEQRLNSSHRL